MPDGKQNMMTSLQAMNDKSLAAGLLVLILFPFVVVQLDLSFDFN